MEVKYSTIVNDNVNQTVYHGDVDSDIDKLCDLNKLCKPFECFVYDDLICVGTSVGVIKQYIKEDSSKKVRTWLIDMGYVIGYVDQPKMTRKMCLEEAQKNGYTIKFDHYGYDEHKILPDDLNEGIACGLREVYDRVKVPAIKTEQTKTNMTNDQHYCELCNEPLKAENIVWMELSNTDGLYYRDEIPKGHKSQGSFAFGSSCWKKANN